VTTSTLHTIDSSLATDYDIVIVGSGPGGLAAASRAQALNNKYVLMEASDHLSDTIFKYQKGKHVMAEPSILPLREGMPFAAGKREDILGRWNQEVESQSIVVQYKKRVTGIQRDSATGIFTVVCEDGSATTTRFVVLGIGLQGNVRKMGVPGDDHPQVQYTLSDPDEYSGETIVVIGAGDAGIENALALSKQNTVLLMNRAEEFNGCKDGNRDLILAAEKSGKIQILYQTTSVELRHNTTDKPLELVVDGRNGRESISCDRIVARLGATPPRKLIEGFGIEFPNSQPTSLPILSENYESNVPGMYIVGALGGYPLIKQAMNQGHEVIDTVNGLPVTRMDEPILRDRLNGWRADQSISDILDYIISHASLLSSLTKLQARELLIESRVHILKPGDVIFEKLDYSNTIFNILEGSVEIHVTDKHHKKQVIRSGQGNFFGEMGLISGRRRTASIYAGPQCVVMETTRRATLKLLSANEEVHRKMDTAFVRNALFNYIGPLFTEGQIDRIMTSGVQVRSFNPHTPIFTEGDPADGLYLIRRGSVTVTKKIDGVERVLSYVAAGNYVGEMALLDTSPRSASVSTSVLTEVLIIKQDVFQEIVQENDALKEALQKKSLERARHNVATELESFGSSDMAQFFLAQGLGAASDALVIDENKCVQCNNCEVACAETHQGVSRLKRQAGATFAKIHVPVACRHCEHPMCMKDCPPDALTRSTTGEITISEACIGCGNCERNCNYGVIQLVVDKPAKRGGGLSWLLFGLGAAPGERSPDYDPDSRKRAVKCDMCTNLSAGPACVRACPTGAATRLSPEKLMRQLATTKL
jgi:CRP-like cAMP-binding protein/Fe-S-cluster-containing hydrogenase component 2/thioredoxin reductase